MNSEEWIPLIVTYAAGIWSKEPNFDDHDFCQINMLGNLIT